MTIVLSAETKKLLETQMKKHGYATPEEAVRIALEKLDEEKGEVIEDLDSELRAAIEEGLAQADRGEGRPWSEVRAELEARFLKK
jgi:hypothetical protein